jgi:hypothetical protein
MVIEILKFQTKIEKRERMQTLRKHHSNIVSTISSRRRNKTKHKKVFHLKSLNLVTLDVEYAHSNKHYLL